MEHLEAPTLKYDACREYMSNGQTTLGNWSNAASDFINTHPVISLIVLLVLFLAFVLFQTKQIRSAIVLDEVIKPLGTMHLPPIDKHSEQSENQN